MQLSWFVNKSHKRRYKLIFLFIYSFIFTLGYGLILSLYLSWVFGLTAAIIAGLDQDIKPIETLHWSWQKLNRKLLLKLILGIILGFLGGFSALLLLRIAFAIARPINLADLIYVLSCGLIGGLIAGLTHMLAGPDIAVKTRPNQGIWRSLFNAGWFGLLIGLFPGLMTALFLTPFYGPIVGLLYGLLVGCGFALLAGLGTGGKVCIQHFALRCVCFFAGYMPWNYARFLDYAADRLLLQRVGGRYRFIHRLLQEYFAAMSLEGGKGDR